MMKHCLFLLALVLSWVSTPPAHGKIIFRVRNLSEVSTGEMVEDLRQARVIFFGERHDSAEDHVAQRTVIQALHEAGEEIAIGMEMFRADAQPALDGWVSRSLDKERFRQVYNDNWAPELYDLYNDILIYARHERIPLVGLNIDRKLVSQVARHGFASLSAGQRRELGVDSCDVTDRYERTLRSVLRGKEMSPRALNNFCQAQITWDAAMARKVAEYLESNPERTMVVLLGTFHAWRHGVPERLEALADVPIRIILPSSDDSFLNYDIILEDADYVWWQQ